MDQKLSFESLLNCPICYDFLQVCMMTKCGHNFCSLCLRKYLSVRSQCPVCFESASEPELINNRIVDDIIKQYTILKRTLDECLDNKKDNENILEKSVSKTQNDSDLEATNAIVPTQTDPPNKALCPVCDELIKIDVMNSHLDVCLTRSERRKSLRKLEYPDKKKKMAKVVYHLLNDNDIKEILDNIGLSTDGDKQTLIRRHKAFLILYNAECDSLTPRPISEIIKQVHKEELSEKKCPKQPKLFQLDKKSDPAIIEKEQEKYLKENKKQFTQLIEDVQSRQLHGAVSKRTNESKLSANEDLEAPSTSKQARIAKDKTNFHTKVEVVNSANIASDIAGRESPTF